MATMDHQTARRIVRQWLGGGAIYVLERQHGISYGGFEALIRRVSAVEPAMVERVIQRTMQQADAAAELAAQQNLW